jgi:dihydrofolate reductase
MPSNGRFIGCVFLGVSVDGFIARLDGDLEWLTSRGEIAGDAGFTPFIRSIDALLMGRRTYDLIAGEPQWPYLGKPVHVLSRTLPPGADERVAAVHPTPADAAHALNDAGYGRVYLDGGRAVHAFLASGLVDEITLSQVPVLIGEGARWSGPLAADLDLEHVRTAVLAGGMVQSTWRALADPHGAS